MLNVEHIDPVLAVLISAALGLTYAVQVWRDRRS